jgi:hypothetical protein
MNVRVPLTLDIDNAMACLSCRRAFDWRFHWVATEGRRMQPQCPDCGSSRRFAMLADLLDPKIRDEFSPAKVVDIGSVR